MLDTNYNLVDYFFMGGSGPMTVLTIFLIGVLIAAWKAPNWVRGIGFSALLASFLWVTITLVQMSKALMVNPDVSATVVWGGILCSLLPCHVERSRDICKRTVCIQSSRHLNP